MMMKCDSPICKREFDTWEHCAFKWRWCSQDCYLSDLDEHLEAKWEADREIREVDEDNWREDR
jgi:hypothetical protein